jgi:hypothetical protein
MHISLVFPFPSAIPQHVPYLDFATGSIHIYDLIVSRKKQVIIPELLGFRRTAKVV